MPTEVTLFTEIVGTVIFYGIDENVIEVKPLSPPWRYTYAGRRICVNRTQVQ